MDPKISAEAASLRPEVAFRASRGWTHHTWARTFYSQPELYLQPESLAEIQKIVDLARRCRRRIVTVGSGHSPSDLTCTSSWMVNLDRYAAVESIDPSKKVATVQAGMRLRDLVAALGAQGLALPSLGSINEQSIAGAISTGTHGSALRHGTLAHYVQGLRLVLANGRVVSCSAESNPELFRAALVSLGALGIVVEVSLKAVPDFNIRWEQHLVSQDSIVRDWDSGLWSQAEFTRVWLFPYMKQCVLWRASKTHEPLRSPAASWFSGRVGYHIYHFLLYAAQYVPRLLPAIERFVIAVQYGRPGVSGVDKGMTGLLMNCLYSQFVNEWAIPLAKGPEALERLSAWFHGDAARANMPFDATGVWVHAPLEVRVADGSFYNSQPFLANTMPDGPSLLLNATLYRPYDLDPPCHERYYAAFEWLMKELGGRPHWAKNFYDVSADDIRGMYPDLPAWRQVRDEVDPDGMFVGDWHRRLLFAGGAGSAGGSTGGREQRLALEESRVLARPAKGGRVMWQGEVRRHASLSPQNSEESFDLMQGAEAKGSVLLDMSDSSSSERM